MFGIYLSPSMYIYQLSPWYVRMYGFSKHRYYTDGSHVWKFSFEEFSSGCAKITTTPMRSSYLGDSQGRHNFSYKIATLGNSHGNSFISHC